MTQTTTRLAAAVILVIAPVAVVVAHRAWGSEVPDPLPTHWDLGGQVNGTTGATAFFAGCLLASAVVAGLGVWAALKEHVAGAAFWTAVTVFGSWLIAAIYVETLYQSRDAAQATDVPNPWWAALLTIAVAIIAAVLTSRLVPRDRSARAASPVGSALDFGATENVVWVGSSTSMAMRTAAVVLALGAAAASFFSWQLGLSLLAAALVFLWVHVLTVRIDDRGVHTLWGPLGWPRFSIPLSEIAVARSEQIEPGQWGGWGYRISPRGRAAVVRRGPGLVIDRANKPTYAVTVDGADTASEVLNGLLVRSRR